MLRSMRIVMGPRVQLGRLQLGKHTPCAALGKADQDFIDPRRRLFALRRNTAEWTSDVTWFHADWQKAALAAVSEFWIKVFLRIRSLLISWDTTWWEYEWIWYMSHFDTALMIWMDENWIIPMRKLAAMFSARRPLLVGGHAVQILDKMAHTHTQKKNMWDVQ